ncbi:hypothetical protein AMECASPLE_007041 [Ameca splendens]|uniref:Uncharacterized protein n=1 Tax=Ameca splendens TaxID=208324 RepID=A0ABV1A6R3_9TELE
MDGRMEGGMRQMGRAWPEMGGTGEVGITGTLGINHSKNHLVQLEETRNSTFPGMPELPKLLQECIDFSSFRSQKNPEQHRKYYRPTLSQLKSVFMIEN